MLPTAAENQVLRDAVEALQTTEGFGIADVTMRILNAGRADAVLTIKLNGHAQKFLAEIKTVDRKLAVAQVKAQLQELIETKYPNHRALLVAPYVTEALASECRKIDLAYIDTAGNLHLPTDAYFIDIRGKARPVRTDHNKYRANTPSGMKTVFALLCKPDLVQGSYRQIAACAQVALGAVGPILDDLQQRDFIRRATNGGRLLRRKDELLREWVTLYPANLRPTLVPQKYRAERTVLQQAPLSTYGACWGGEYGAERLAGYLKAEEFLIYTPMPVPLPLVQAVRLRLDPTGNTEILQRFWNLDLFDPKLGIAPPLLIYADLMATADERNREAAQHIYERDLRKLFS